MSDAAPAAPTSHAPAGSTLYRLTLIAALLTALVLVHSAALRLGLFMDDLAHFRQLREADWSLVGLTAACRLELVGGTVELWWLPDTTLRFFRPVAFGLMKLAYSIVGWSPGAMHVVSLGWHAAVCLLTFALLRRCGSPWLLAWAVATLFAIHPGHTATVQWIACQSELIVTTILVGATSLFALARGWPLGFSTNRIAPEAGSVAPAISRRVSFGLSARRNAPRAR